MKQFPIYMKVTNRRVCFIGNDEAIIAKARLISKSEALLEVYAPSPDALLSDFLTHQASHITTYNRDVSGDDITDPNRPEIAFAYLSDEDEGAIATLKAAGIPYCVIDNLQASRFTTPALVDRAPLTIAIGTEGTAPVLARLLKKDLEERLPLTYGRLARVAGQFRKSVARRLSGAHRRAFWADFFTNEKLTSDSAARSDDHLLQDAEAFLQTYEQASHNQQPPIWFVGAGPGDPELLTLQARRLLHDADVVLHDWLVPAPILELCRREAEVISVGKRGFSGGWQQSDINALMVEKAQQGGKLVRLKSGDPTLFGRLDEEIAFVSDHGIAFHVAPGLSSATVGAAHMGASVTRRGRNSSYRCLTGHDVHGYTEHNWREMAKGLNDQQFTACVYMGRQGAAFLSGRLLMHGANRDITVTIAENISRPEARWHISTLASLATDIKHADIKGPVILYLGLRPHAARQSSLKTQTIRGEAYVTEQA